MKTGIELIAALQIEKHGYDKQFVDEHPEYYEAGELAYVAEMLLACEHEEGIDPNVYPEAWPQEDRPYAT